MAIGATITAVLLTVVEIGEAVAAWPAGNTYAQAARNRVPVDNIITIYDLTALVWLALALATFIVSCLWLYMARTNAQLLSTRAHVRSRGWVWAGWLVPIVSAWFPYQVVRDTRRSIRSTAGRALIGWWWAAWLVFVATSQVGSSMVPITGQVSEPAARALGPVETVNAVVALAACALWCVLLWRITREQQHIMRGQPQPWATTEGAGYPA